mmetsp:Transcript_31285/g.76949  ORF Transcript_31285/g.76949 Transcript_31285/m.76949 type:complete len:206 (+) Transcript_31285:204-821(+)
MKRRPLQLCAEGRTAHEIRSRLRPPAQLGSRTGPADREIPRPSRPHQRGTRWPFARSLCCARRPCGRSPHRCRSARRPRTARTCRCHRYCPREPRAGGQGWEVPATPASASASTEASLAPRLASWEGRLGPQGQSAGPSRCGWVRREARRHRRTTSRCRRRSPLWLLDAPGALLRREKTGSAARRGTCRATQTCCRGQSCSAPDP